MSIVWKPATDWAQNWKSEGGRGPSVRYDLDSYCEVDKQTIMRKLMLHEYSYIYRRPVLDMGRSTSIEFGASTFNWLPPIVLASGNKLKVWGTWEVGNGPLTINGVVLLKSS